VSHEPDLLGLLRAEERIHGIDFDGAKLAVDLDLGRTPNHKQQVGNPFRNLQHFGNEGV
jgi:hypothetical protein